MPSFGLTPINPFPGPEESFPTGIQFQDEGVDVGEPNPTNVNFTGLGVTATYNPATDTVDVDISASGSGGSAATLEGFSARKTAQQTSGRTVIFESTAAPRFDTGIYDETTGVATIVQAGVYRARASVYVENGDLEAAFDVGVDIIMMRSAVPTQIGFDTQSVAAAGVAMLMPDAGAVVLEAGDMLYVARNASDWNSNLSVLAGTYCHFTVERIGDTPA